MKTLVFDIWGDYGHFRKFYTTTSPLTFSFPPPPTIAGILGAIYGTGKDAYLKIFSSDKCQIAIRIINSVKKARMGLNLVETKGTNLKRPFSDRNLALRTQIRTEFVKDVCFRIYCIHNDQQIIKGLQQFLVGHKNIYTVSMGLSELLANFKYVGLFDTEKITNGKTAEIFTPIVVSNIVPGGLEIETGKKYFKEKIPLVMTPDRIVKNYEDVIFEPDGKSIKTKVYAYYKLENGENITFF
jgi:CRISPR-associated protein Cas5h